MNRFRKSSDSKKIGENHFTYGLVLDSKRTYENVWTKLKIVLNLTQIAVEVIERQNERYFY